MTTDPVLEQEHLILDVTEMIVELMNERGVTRSELADRLGKTKGHVSQLLSGSRNLTLRTLSDIFVALDFRFCPWRCQRRNLTPVTSGLVRQTGSDSLHREPGNPPAKKVKGT